MNTTSKFLTYETQRDRFVFQLRIPTDLRKHFAGRTTIRKSLGSIPQEAAEVRVQELASQHLAEFGRLRNANPPSSQPLPNATPLKCTERTGVQLAYTWQRHAAAALKNELARLQDATTTEWDMVIVNTQAELAEIREHLRRSNTRSFSDELASLEQAHGFVLEVGQTDIAVLSRQFHATRVEYLAKALQVLSGTLDVEAVTPTGNALLPLVQLWGTRALELPERWADGKRSIGLSPNLKTHDKYRLIARDCDAVLGGRPVESLDDDDLAALKEYWRSRGNGGSTIVGKLDQLLQLVQQLGQDSHIEKVFDNARPVRGKLKTKRLPFTQEQVSEWGGALEGDDTLSNDDRILAYLLLLTGARLEELCQLTVDDISISEHCWQIRIADGTQIGTDATIKNSVSARRLPVPRGLLPQVDNWLDRRIHSTGQLFPDLTPNKYGELSNAVGKRLNRRLRSLLGPDRRLVLLSSRPTVNRVMRRAGIDPRVRYRQLGHADVGIHDKHYDAAEHFDDADLLPAATVIAHWLAAALGLQAAQGIQGLVHGENPCSPQTDTTMHIESGQAALPLQQFRMEENNSEFLAVSPEPSDPTPLAAHPTVCNHNANTEVTEGKINRILPPSRFLSLSAINHAGREINVGDIKQPRDDELRRCADRSTTTEITGVRPMGCSRGNFIQVAQAHGGLVGRCITVAPALVVHEFQTALHVEPDIFRKALCRRMPDAQEHGIQTPGASQVLAGIRMVQPGLFRVSDAGTQKDRDEIVQ